jgi:hypothetical protein
MWKVRRCAIIRNICANVKKYRATSFAAAIFLTTRIQRSNNAIFSTELIVDVLVQRQKQTEKMGKFAFILYPPCISRLGIYKIGSPYHFSICSDISCSKICPFGNFLLIYSLYSH